MAGRPYRLFGRYFQVIRFVHRFDGYVSLTSSSAGRRLAADQLGPAWMGGLMQHYIARSGHRADLAGLWHATQPVTDRHRASASAGRRVFRITLALLAGLAVAGHVGWLAFTHTGAAPRPQAASTTTRQRSDAAAAEWIRANLPTGIHLLADAVDPPAGYQPVSLAAAGKNWTNYSYLVTATNTAPPADSALATVWKSSVAVAMFDDIQVRYVLALTPPDQIQRDRDADDAERLRAGAALQNNPQLTSSPTAKAILATGGLDLRAAAVLTALVGQVPVVLNNIAVVAAEAAAKMPARSITIYSSDPATVTQALSGLAAAFAPDQVTVGENGAIELHWPISVTPMRSVPAS